MPAALKPNRSYKEIDEQDRQIIACLKDNGRASNQAIARRLNVSPTLVGTRIRRLERQRILRMVLVADFDVIGADLLLAVSIKVSRRRPREVARALAALDEVFSCSIMVGSHDIEALVALPNVSGVRQFIEVDLAAIEGISEVAVDIAADMIKYEFDVVPFTR